MLLSPILLFWTLLIIYKSKPRRTQPQADASGLNALGDFSFEKLIAVGGVCMHAGSLASSSFVEEEQYTYHFLVATLCVLFLRHALLQPHQLFRNFTQTLAKAAEGEKETSIGIQKNAAKSSTVSILFGKFGKFSSGDGDIATKFSAVVVILVCGRVLRAWHRSGVNWAHLPDIAKWLDSVDAQVSIALRYVALLFATTSSCLLILSPARQQHRLRKLLACCLCVSAAVIFVYVDSESGQVPTLFGSTSYPDQTPTILARLVFGMLGSAAILAILFLPWMEPLWWDRDKPTACFPISSALQSTGHVLVSCWCLLQLLLQQSVNAGPVALLLIQLLATIAFFRQRGNNFEMWFQVHNPLTRGWCVHSHSGNLLRSGRVIRST